MKNLKLAISVAFAAAFAAFTLLHSGSVNGQAGGLLAAPTGVQASDGVYNNKVAIQWDTIRGATNYRVFRSSVNDPSTAIDVAVTAQNSFLDNQAPAGQNLFYWVRAENSSGASLLSSGDQGLRANTQGQGPQLLPPPPPNPGNPTTATKVYLGKALFWDEQMSSTRTVACGTCHHSANGGTDPRSVAAAAASLNVGPDGLPGTPDDIRGSQGVPSNDPDGRYVHIQHYELNAQVTGRKTVSYVNAAYAPLLFWDGRATGDLLDPITGAIVLNGGAALESQVLGPPVSSAEMGHNGRDWNDVAARVAGSRPLALSPSIPAPLRTWINGRNYPELFLEAFGTSEVTPTRIAMAIAAFERSLYTDRAPIDLDVAGIQPLSPAANRGRGLFNQMGPGGTDCAACHAGPTFSDNQFHNIGVRPQNEDLGRGAITLQPQNNGQFRTPDLRNVDLRGSFLHNGQFTTLEQVVQFYNRGGDFRGPGNPNLDPRIRPLGLNAAQQADLVAFLHALTDPRMAAEQAPFDRPMLYTESNRVPVETGNGVAGTGGIIPQIKAISPPVLGNTNFTVSLNGALGNATAILVVSQRNYTYLPPRSSRQGLFRGSIVTQNTGAGNGWASVSFAFPDTVNSDATYYARWFIEDPGAPGGYSMTPAMKFTLFSPTWTAGPAPAADAADEQDAHRKDN
jgi:cytochrome c peroxidase